MFSGKTASRICAILSGLFFCVSAIMKLLDLDSFKLYIFSLIPIPFTLVEICVYFLLGVELGIGICLVLNISVRDVCRVGLLLMGLFSVFLIWRIFIGDDENCHCFGSKIAMSPKVSLIKNAIITTLLIPGLNAEKPSARIRLTSIAILVAAVILSAAISFPYFMVKKTKTEDLISEELFTDFWEKTYYSEDVAIVSFLSIHCNYCKKYITKLNTLVSRSQVPENIHIVLLDEGAELKEIDTFFEEYANGLRFTYSLLSADVFLPIVRGNIPVGVYLQGGKINKSFDLISLNEKSFGIIPNK